MKSGLATRATPASLVVVLLVSMIVMPVSAAQNGASTPPAPAQAGASTPVAEAAEVDTDPPITEDASACADGRLLIQDLAQAEIHLREGLARVEQRATAWQPDARLVELRLSCPLLKTGLQWEGTYFSETAQANFSTNTFDIEPSEDAPEVIPFLNVTEVSFQVVYRSLLRAGYADDLRLAAASSVTVRLSTERVPFGPSTAPRGIVYVHVAVEERGVVKDVWINAEDGTIYRYDLGG
jgi:hypothetical protein